MKREALKQVSENLVGHVTHLFTKLRWTSMFRYLCFETTVKNLKRFHSPQLYISLCRYTPPCTNYHRFYYCIHKPDRIAVYTYNFLLAARHIHRVMRIYIRLRRKITQRIV